MQQNFYKLTFFFITVFLLTTAIVASTALQVHADTLNPDFCITWDEANSTYVVKMGDGTPKPSGSEHCSFTDAIQLCTGENPIIQLGNPDQPLPLIDSANQLRTATYTGNVVISDSAVTTQGFVIPDGVTADFQGLTLKNTTTPDMAYCGVAVYSGGTLNVLPDTSIEITSTVWRDISCIHNNGTVNMNGGTLISQHIGIQSSGMVTINGGSISGTNYGVLCNSGPCNISGGSISSSGMTICMMGTTEEESLTISGNPSITATGFATAIHNQGAGRLQVGGNPNDNIIISSLQTGISNCSAANNIIGTGTHVVAKTAIYNSAIVANSTAVLTIEDGEFTSASDGGYTLSNSSSGTLTISGGVITQSGQGAQTLFNQGTTVISGGTLRQTECTNSNAINYCIKTSGKLDIKGDCKISCAGTGPFSTAIYILHTNSTSVSVSENAEISGQASAISSASSTCPIEVNGGIITASGASNSVYGIVAPGEVNISSGTISATGKSAAAVYISSVHAVLHMNGGTISATSDTSAVAIDNSFGTIYISAGSITATATGENMNAIAIRNNSLDKTTLGKIFISGGFISAVSAESITTAQTYGILNSGSGSITGGTIKSNSSSGYSSCISGEGFTGVLAISGSPSLQSASEYTIMTKLTTDDTLGFNYYGLSFYNISQGYVYMKGMLDNNYYVIDGSNYSNSTLHASHFTSEYNFAAWTNDLDRHITINTTNGATYAVLTSTGTTMIYVKYIKPPLTSPFNCTFVDTDYSAGKIQGTIHWDAPTDTTGLDGYKIYWGDKNWNILPTHTDALYTIADINTISAVVAPGTVLPEGAKCFLFYGYNAAGNSFASSSLAITDSVPSVKLTKDSSGTAGDCKITELEAGLIYQVTVYDESNQEVTKYTKSDGTLTGSVSEAAPLTGKEITGLNNNYIYRVSQYNKDTLTLAPGSLGIAGNMEIKGLIPGLKYTIMASVGEAPVTLYHTADGQLTQEEEDWQPLTGTTIVEAPNEYTYFVQADKVVLTKDSFGLAGDGKITGITSGAIYKIAATDALGVKTVSYVKADGSITSSSSEAATLTAAEILGLKNGLLYKVESYTPEAPSTPGSSESGGSSTGSSESSVSSQSSGSSSGSSDTKSTNPNLTSVIVGSKTIAAGVQSTGTSESGRTITTVTVTESTLAKQLETASNQIKVTVPISGSQNIKSSILTGQMVKDMENKEAILEVKTDTASYVIPAQQINISEISKRLGVAIQLSDIKVQVCIEDSGSAERQAASAAIADKGSSIVVPPMNFTLTAEYNGNKVTVDTFNNYVSRLIPVPAGTDASKITTGVLLNTDGSIRHIPTHIKVINGAYYAEINSLTNSTYFVIWNPIEFVDVKAHWAKEAINNMGSRLIVNGTDQSHYDPNGEISRAEFAAIIVRALGLAPTTGETPFSDISSDKWYYGYVKTASTYGLITGIDEAHFNPTATITREQAMSMIARAMKITGLSTTLTDTGIKEILSSYTDASKASVYAKADIAVCLKSGLITGRNNDTIAVKDDITRAEAAVIIENLLKKSDLI